MKEAGLKSARAGSITRVRNMIRRLGTTVVFGLVKGMATSVGGAIVTGVVWWAGHR
jgi:hypothetical protein